jgi:hypothetical protein
MKRKPKFDPSLPLRNPRHEAFARARAAMEKPIRAMELAGYDKPTAGNAARLDRHPHIIARIRHFANNDNTAELLAQRRNRLRGYYETLAFADRTKLFAEVEVPERDEKGNPIEVDGKVLTKHVRQLRPFDDLFDEGRLLIEALEFDGEKYKIKSADRLAAMKALRELDGLDRPHKVAITDPEGKQSEPSFTDRDRAKALAVFVAKTRAQA